MVKGRLKVIWSEIRGSFWFIPGVLAAASIALSFAMVEVDKAIDSSPITDLRWVMDSGADGVRAVLQTIAGSMITVAGTVFSITIIALTLASQQFGPRLLRNFMRDRGNQFVLGTFTATFLFCILVLRTVSGQDEAEFIPRISAIVAVALAVLSVGVLIYFIHHVAISIQAPYIIAGVANELDDQISEMFPEMIGESLPAEHSPPLPEGFESRAVPICFKESGYLQNIDEDGIIDVAMKYDIVVRLRCRPGAFATSGEPFLEVWPPEHMNDESTDHLQKAFSLGRARTAKQDISFAVDQLVEVAAKSLSPSINDPFTAISCIDRLGDAFARLSRRRIPSPARLDKQGKVRIFAEPFRLAELVIQSFEPIRFYAGVQILVVLRLLDTIAVLAPSVRREEDRRILLEEVDNIAESFERESHDEPQRRRIRERSRRVRDAIVLGRLPDVDATGNPLSGPPHQ